jgi:zinc/manganese transport system ATP-binding protein
MGPAAVTGDVVRGDAVIHLENLTVGYDRHPAVHHLSGVFRPGSLTAVMGPNGAGKSTLIKAVIGLIRPMEGQVRRDGVRRADIAYAPQMMDMDLSFPLSVGEAVSLGHWPEIGAFGGLNRGQWDQTLAALHAVGLEGFTERTLDTLSVGQRQRVAFARLMVADAKVIVLDEPFAAVDMNTTQDLLKLIVRWGQEGRTVIAVLHDEAQARAAFPETLLLARELVAWGPTAEVLTEANLARSKAMAQGWLDHAPLCDVSGAM